MTVVCLQYCLSLKGTLAKHIFWLRTSLEITTFPVKRDKRMGLGGKIRKSIQKKVYCGMPNYDKKIMSLCPVMAVMNGLI